MARARRNLLGLFHVRILPKHLILDRQFLLCHLLVKLDILLHEQVLRVRCLWPLLCDLLSDHVYRVFPLFEVNLGLFSPFDLLLNCLQIGGRYIEIIFD